MDHAYASTIPFVPLPPEVTATGARIVSFLHSGGRVVVLVGPPQSGKTTTLDAVLAGMPAWVERVSNQGVQTLTLARILSQIGAPADEDQGPALVRTLIERAGTTAPAVLAVDDAHTLSPDALSALAGIPGLGGPGLPGLMLLLSGDPALLRMLQTPGLDSLRAGKTLTLRMPPPGSLARAAEMRDHAAAPNRPPARRWPAVAAVLAGAALSIGLLVRAPAAPPPASPNALTAPAYAASPADAPDASVPAQPRPEDKPRSNSPGALPDDLAALPEPAQAVPAASRQMRRDFDLFLDRAGRDTVRLTPGAREELFREYLQWRAQARH